MARRSVGIEQEAAEAAEGNLDFEFFIGELVVGGDGKGGVAFEFGDVVDGIGSGVEIGGAGDFVDLLAFAVVAPDFALEMGGDEAPVA